MGLSVDFSKQISIVSKKFALLIGVETFDDPAFKNVKGVKKDIENFSKILRKSEFSKLGVKSLLNPKLLDAKKAISDIGSQAKKDDVIFFYYSGAGFLDSNESFFLKFRDSDSSYKDATCMESEFILSQFKKSECENFIVIIDTCYSGAFFNNNRGLPKGVVVLTASDDRHEAGGTKEGGIFTNIIVKGLNSDYIDSNRDGKITFSELFDYVINQTGNIPSEWGRPRKWEWNVDRDFSLFDIPRPVFISYHHDQLPLVKKISSSLTDKEILTFVDKEKLRASDYWWKRIAKTIKDSRVFLVVLEKGFLESKISQCELAEAHKHKVPIMQILIDNSDIPITYEKEYGVYHRLIFDTKDYERSINILIEQIKALRIEQLDLPLSTNS